MDKWRITPKDCLGPLSLNATLETLESVLGTDYERFFRGGNQMLAYDSQGVHVEMDDGGQTRAITAFPPCQVSLGGVDLLGREISDVKRDLDEVGLPFEIVDAGLWSERLLIMLVEQDGRIDGVEVRRVPY